MQVVKKPLCSVPAFILYLLIWAVSAPGSQLRLHESHSSPTVPLTPGDLRQAFWSCLSFAWGGGKSSSFLLRESGENAHQFRFLRVHVSTLENLPFCCSWWKCSSVPCQPPSVFLGRGRSSPSNFFYMSQTRGSVLFSLQGAEVKVSEALALGSAIATASPRGSFLTHSGSVETWAFLPF